MGLHDRDYMGDERGGWRKGWPMWGRLILVNLVVFVIWLVAAGPFMQANFTVSAPGVLEQGRIWTLFTSAISHMAVFHFLFNMLFLWVFAQELERVYGPGNLLVLYLFGAAVSGAAHIGWAITWGNPAVPALGASGSVMAVAITATLFFPHKRLYIWGVIPAPFWALAGLFVFLDIVGIAGGANDGVAHAAHLGGAVAGLTFKLLDLRPFGERETVDGIPIRRTPRHPSEIPLDDRIGPPEPYGPPGVDPALAARVDEILRKINREGLGALTEDERELLDEASEAYRK